MAYVNRWESGGVCKVFAGNVNGQQVLDSITEVEADDRFDQIHFVINDFLDVSSVSATEKEIARIAAIDRAASLSNPSLRIAIVTTSDEIRELASLYSKFMAGSAYETALFDTLKAARDWVTGEPARV